MVCFDCARDLSEFPRPECGSAGRLEKFAGGLRVARVSVQQHPPPSGPLRVDLACPGRLLRSGIAGLSFALPTVARVCATRPWNIAYNVRSHSKPAYMAAPVSTGNRVRAAGESPLPKAKNVVTGWKEESRRIKYASAGRRGGRQFNVAHPATAQDAKADPCPKLAHAPLSSNGSRSIRRKARAALKQRIRPLRWLPPRFSHPRIETRHVLLPAAHTSPDVLHGQQEPHQRQPFWGTRGETDPVHWNSHPVDALLRRIDQACVSRGEASPSSTISQELHNLASGKDLQRVWTSYLNVTRIQNTHPVVREIFPSSRIPNKLLSRLCHFIIHSRPITASHFPSLLTAMQHLWDIGSAPQRTRWNSLIRFAAGGQRRGGKHGVRKSLAILNDYVRGLRPGSSLGGRIASLRSILDAGSPNKPNISTFNILIHVAAEAMDGRLLRDAIDLLDEFDLVPTRITYLAQLKYYAERKQLDRVRGVLLRLNEEGMDLGVDGINACLWAYALSGHHTVALGIYRVLRDNHHPDQDTDSVAQLRYELETYEHILVPPDARPDKRTYVLLIQTMAYSGEFTEAISVFADFLEYTPRGRVHSSTAPAFRAIFLRF
ncbi:hypothetical protein NMY22_g6496 [Coprinellus aureogranulatus]|nr:hypothetical protein NMY22_g6496 [Coprinellus aureogranulatus]